MVTARVVAHGVTARAIVKPHTSAATLVHADACRM
jgi:hypothetical protein